MGIYEDFEEQLNNKKDEIIETMNEIMKRGIHENVERLDIIIFPGDYEIVNVIIYSMNKSEEVFYKGKQFSGSVNLTGPIFLDRPNEIIGKDEDNKIKAQMLYSLEDILEYYAKSIDTPMQLLFYKSPQAYDLKSKSWVMSLQPY